MPRIIQIFLPMPKELINEPSKVAGYEKFWAMTNQGANIFNMLSDVGLQPLYTVCNREGKEVRDENGQLLFTGFLIHKEIEDANA